MKGIRVDNEFQPTTYYSLGQPIFHHCRQMLSAGYSDFLKRIIWVHRQFEHIDHVKPP